MEASPGAAVSRPAAGGLSPRAKDGGAIPPSTSAPSPPPKSSPGGAAIAVYSGGHASPESHLPALLAVLTIVALPVIASLAAAASPQLIAPLLGFRTGPLTPAVCQPHSRSVSSSPPHLPTLYFVTGVDGAGHGFFTAFFSLLKERANLTIEKYDPGVHLTASPEQVMESSKAGLKKWKGCPKLPYSRQVYDFGAEITARLAALQQATGVPFRGLYVRTSDTIPMGPIQTPLARPDLVALGMYHGILYTLKAIVLVREPAAIMTDRVRNKTFSSDPGLLFRITEDSLTYLDASVRQLPCGSYAAVNMDVLLNSAGGLGEASIATSLASFLEIDSVGPVEILDLLSQARSLYSNPEAQRRRLAQAEGTGTGKVKVNEEVQAWRKEFEDPSSARSLLWPLYSALKTTAFFLPLRPSQWPE